MTFRTRILLAALVAAIAPLTIFALGARQQVREELRAQSERRTAASSRLRCCDTFGAASPTVSASSETVISSRSRSASRIRRRVGSDSSAKRRATSSTNPGGTVTTSQ